MIIKNRLFVDSSILDFSWDELIPLGKSEGWGKGQKKKAGFPKISPGTDLGCNQTSFNKIEPRDDTKTSAEHRCSFFSYIERLELGMCPGIPEVRKIPVLFPGFYPRLAKILSWKIRGMYR